MTTKKKSPLNIFDKPQSELQQLSQAIAQKTAKSPTVEITPAPQPEAPTQPAPVAKSNPAAKPKKEKTKPAPLPPVDENVKVIRISESFHRRAKIKAAILGMQLGTYIEQLIDGDTDRLG